MVGNGKISPVLPSPIQDILTIGRTISQIAVKFEILLSNPGSPVNRYAPPSGCRYHACLPGRATESILELYDPWESNVS